MDLVKVFITFYKYCVGNLLNLPLKQQQITGPILITLICCLLWLFEPTASEYFALQRDLVAKGYLWQFLTANFVHTNTTHLLLNLTGVTLLWAVHGQYYNVKIYLINIVLLSIGVTIGIYLFSNNLLWYAGLSGTLHGIFVYGAYLDIRNKVKFGWLLMFGVWLKVSYEQLYGADQMIKDLIAANVAVDAHLYGAVAGLGCIVLNLVKGNYLPQDHRGK
ncbi:rhombosortase [Aliiglaciecola sp. 3_MG-2023]|uniref:rhombosortase n=1 Tax=Aliiglaciecola sp. 3_MG-2023 TaxID=3062644 RepID=UPI0026E28BA4|nr:rhombosortase [Aliiglaciecola sp. 3_MG-2023]MDO6692455.1 rhombosortase [Aliiglaciecola sp. 3_MG-2023]